MILAGCSKEESDFAGTDNHIISFEMKVGSENYKAVILDNEIRLTVPKGTDLSQGKPDIVLCENMRLTRSVDHNRLGRRIPVHRHFV